MSKKNNPNWISTETVYTETQLKEAAKKEYGTIIVKGEIAREIIKNIDRNPKLRKIANWTIVFGIFLWPLLLVGIAGRILTATDLKNYQVDSVSDEELILQRKDKK